MSKKSRRVAKARRALFTLSLVLVTMAVAVGGTIAWLQAETDPVTNTFSATGLEIELTEKTAPKGGTLEGEWKADILPGASYYKDPTVKVLADSEDCWLFVEVTLSPDLSNYFQYDLIFDDNDSNWEQVEVAPNYDTQDTDKLVSTTYVYGIEAKAGDEYKLLNKVNSGNYEIVVPNTLKKDNMPSDDVIMKFQAYAIQKEALVDSNGASVTTAAKAWEVAEPLVK